MTVLHVMRWGVLRTWTKKRHHHLIYIKCGQAISFQEDLWEELEAGIAETGGFCVVNHEVRLYGCCVEYGGDLIEEKRE